MKQEPQQEVHHDETVWVNPTTEALRKEECLCLNCGNMKPGKPDHCYIANQLYQISVKENIAMTITRCPIWKPKT